MTQGTAHLLAAVCLVLSVAATFIITPSGWPAPAGFASGLFVGLAVAALGLAWSQGAKAKHRRPSSSSRR